MSATAVSLFRERVRRYGDRVAIRSLRAGGAAADSALSWRGWGEAVDHAAAGLIAAGCRPGEVGAVLAGNTMVWPVADLAILSAGMVSAGIYPTSAPAQVRQLLADSGASVVFVDTPEQLAKVRAVAAELPRLRLVVGPPSPYSPAEERRSGGAEGSEIPLNPRFAKGDFTSVQRWPPCRNPGFWVPPFEKGGSGGIRGEGLPVVGWDVWLRQGQAALLEPGIAAELGGRAAALRPADTAVLIYTSGSTGEPKGACISHRYLLASAASIRETLQLTDADTTLSFLPFCHAGERVFGLYTRILCGMEAGLVEDHTRLWEAARAYGPTVFGGLPRFYEKVYEALQAERAAARGEERERWERVLEAGRVRSQLLRTGATVPAGHEESWRAEGAPLFERVRHHFGGRLRLATSGGASLPCEVAEFLDALGVTVLGAYGLTEHLCVAFNRADRYLFDGVGPPMPGSMVRIAEDGEILVRRCDLTFSGYLNRPAETAESFTPDGEWLLTGDLGTLDAAGFLHVTGRKKELIALSTGKKVAPLVIEARLLEDPWISQVMLYGEGRKFISALICLRRPVIEAWAREQGGEVGGAHGPNADDPANGDFAALVRLPAVQARVQAAVERVNAGLSRTEQIRRVVVLDRDLTLENDELTPTLKLRRAVIAARYHEQLDALYIGKP
jgi:long-chain acyl-CoA synthetase